MPIPGASSIDLHDRSDHGDSAGVELDEASTRFHGEFHARFDDDIFTGFHVDIGTCTGQLRGAQFDVLVLYSDKCHQCCAFSKPARGFAEEVRSGGMMGAVR